MTNQVATGMTVIASEAVAFAREKVALAVIPLSSVLFYHFSLRYTRGAARQRTLLFFYGLAAVSAVLAMTNQVATGMTVKFYGFAPELGWAFGRRNRLFTLFLLAMATWGIAIFGMRDAFPDEAVAFAREKVALAVIPLSSVLFYHFSLRYTRGAARQRTLLFFYGLAAVSAVLAMTNQVATGMTVKFYGFAPELDWAFGDLVGDRHIRYARRIPG